MKYLLLTTVLLLQLNYFAQSTKKITSIFFERKSYTIGASELSKIDSLIPKLKTNELFISGVVAYCDTFGSEESNLTLANLRIDALEKVLSGYAIAMPKAIALGEGYPTNSSNHSDYAFWRRIDIECTVLPVKVFVSNTKERVDKPEEVQPVLQFPKSKKFDVDLNENGIGDIINLNIQFYPGEARLWNTFSYKEVDDLYVFLAANTHISVLIRGHVCCENDLKLSLNRAKTIYDILVGRGIEKERIRYEGFGNTLPIAIENSDDSRQKNRRVDVIFSKTN